LLTWVVEICGCFKEIHYWLLLILDLVLFCKILNYLITNNCEQQWWKAHELKKCVKCNGGTLLFVDLWGEGHTMVMMAKLDFEGDKKTNSKNLLNHFVRHYVTFILIL
jgi:hypothetical protein